MTYDNLDENYSYEYYKKLSTDLRTTLRDNIIF